MLNNKIKDEYVKIAISKSNKNKLKRLANEKKTTLTGLIEEALNEYMASSKKTKLIEIGVDKNKIPYSKVTNMLFDMNEDRQEYDSIVETVSELMEECREFHVRKCDYMEDSDCED